MTEVLVIDDEIEAFEDGIRDMLKEHSLLLTPSGRQGLELLDDNPMIEAVLLDISMPADFAAVDMREGVEVLNRIRQAHPKLPVIMLTALDERDLIVECMGNGAHDYLFKPPDRDLLRDTVRRAIASSELKNELSQYRNEREVMLAMLSVRPAEESSLSGIIGQSPALLQVCAQIRMVAPFEKRDVILLGETGVGKEGAARAIHDLSPLENQPYLVVNCSAISAQLLESELFGYVKGAFTGADGNKNGRFEQADGGTLFLDEFLDMPNEMQAKLLRVLGNGEIQKVGGATTHNVDVRVIFATNKDLKVAVENGTLRKDLYYRVNGLPIVVPPLRWRKSDIPLLAEHFAGLWEEENKKQVEFDGGVMGALAEYDWPGNVRELRSFLEKLFISSPYGLVTEEHVRAMPEIGPKRGEVEDPQPTASIIPSSGVIRN